MKILMRFLLPFAAIMLLLSSCGGKGDKVHEIKGLTEYSDPILNFSIKYPSNWDIQKSPGDRFIAITSKQLLKRFRNWEPEGNCGAKVEIMAIKLSEGVTFDSIVAKQYFTAETYSKPENISVDGIQGIRQTYKFELGDGLFEGEIYFAQKHPEVVTIITFEAFGSTLESYKKDFDEILKSVKLGTIKEKRQDTVKITQEAPPPSSNLVASRGDGFSIMVPDNFDIKNPKATGILKSYQFIGERRADCDIRVDIIDAAKQSKLDKIVEDNKSRHKNASPRATSLGGEKAFVFEYSPVAGVMSKVWYTLKGPKLYRVTMNWFTGEEKDFKPVFEKSVNSFKFQ